MKKKTEPWCVTKVFTSKGKRKNPKCFFMLLWIGLLLLGTRKKSQNWIISSKILFQREKKRNEQYSAACFLFQLFKVEGNIGNRVWLGKWLRFEIKFFFFFGFILPPQENDGGIILRTNLHPIRSYPVSKYFGCCLKSCPENFLLVSVPPSREKHRKGTFSKDAAMWWGRGWNRTFQS